MLIGKTVTLSELENMLRQAEREYSQRMSTVLVEHSKKANELREENQYSSANDQRFVTQEFREKYYELDELRNEHNEIEKTLEYFRNRISELENYEDRLRTRGIFVKKEEETYELQPKDLEMIERYSPKEEIKKEPVKKTTRRKPGPKPKTAAEKKAQAEAEEDKEA